MSFRIGHVTFWVTRHLRCSADGQVICFHRMNRRAWVIGIGPVGVVRL